MVLSAVKGMSIDFERFTVEKLDKKSRQRLAEDSEDLAEAMVVAIMVKALTETDFQDADKIEKLREQGRLRLIDKKTGEVIYANDVEKIMARMLTGGGVFQVTNKTTGEAMRVDHVTVHAEDLFNAILTKMVESVQKAQQDREKPAVSLSSQRMRAVGAAGSGANRAKGRAKGVVFNAKSLQAARKKFQAKVAAQLVGQAAKRKQQREFQVKKHHEEERVEQDRSLAHEEQERSPGSDIRYSTHHTAARSRKKKTHE